MMADVIANALLEALPYALRRDGVQVADRQDLVDNGRVRGLDLCRQLLCTWSVHVFDASWGWGKHLPVMAAVFFVVVVVVVVVIVVVIVSISVSFAVVLVSHTRERQTAIHTPEQRRRGAVEAVVV